MESFSAWAPGRVNLIGEHTDYSGGLVLPIAIQLGVRLEVRSIADDVALSSDRFGPAEPFAPDGSGPPAVGWARYVQAVAAELAALGREPVGLSGVVHSDLPAGAGLSSSAAVEVAIALALCAVAGFTLEPLELALACQRAELRAVGVPCGILDQAGCILGSEGRALLLDCATLAHQSVSVPDEAAILVVPSGVERSLEDTPYAQRRAELEHALRLAGVERSTDATLAALDGLDPLSTKRLRHVVTENERVRQFAASFEHGNLETAGRLLTESHTSLRDDYEVSIPQLDELVEISIAAGGLGARLLGAGFGGSVLVLVEAECAHEVAQAVADGAVVARASGGARVVRPG
jgi:galactokinase